MSTAQLVEPRNAAEVVQRSINTIRTLSIDAVEQAKSGHPGTPMALAPLVYTLWNRVMQFDPQDPIWPNRDRFVLSNGHASMLLWSLLHLTRTCAVNSEYERLGQPSVTLDDIRHFRQLDSHAPGHPEYHWVSGVETTTGPLGQGVATSVGMAIAEKWLAHRYNRTGFPIFDYNIYAVCGDGCLMEGISSEAASLAGHLGLDNLCWIFDNNHITIEGDTNITFTEDVAGRFLAYGWNVLRVGDANDIDRIEHAFQIFRRTKDRPTALPSSFWTAISAMAPQANRALRPHMESRSERKRSASLSATTDGPKTQSSWYPRGSTTTSPGEWARAARWQGANGRKASARIGCNTLSQLTRSTGCSAANSRPVGTATSLSSPPIRKASQAARRLGKRSMRLRRTSLGSSGALRISDHRTRRF